MIRPLLDRLAHRIAGPTIGQLERELTHTRRDLDALKADLALREAICPACGPVSRCDEDRCCSACGRDLIVVADKMSAELLVDAFAERDTLQARLDALTPKPVPPLPEGRRRHVLMAVDWLTGDAYSPTAPAVAEYLRTDPPTCLAGLSSTSIERFVSRLAAEPERWLVSDGKKPARYRLTDAGRADLAGVAA